MGRVLEKNCFETPRLQQVVNVASVPQRSPFRYPGGKTWLVPRIRRWLTTLGSRPRVFVEPFAGGAIAGLTAAFEDLTDKVVLAEIDDDVAAVWRTILSPDASVIVEKILGFQMTYANVRATLGLETSRLAEKAFHTILRNRVQHGGILAPGASLMKEGENGKGVASRWYPETLAKRILNIAGIRSRIQFKQDDGFNVIRSFANDRNAVFFVDPPYTVAGRRLYRHSEVDHAELFRLMSDVKGSFLLTYDDSFEVRRWVRRNGLKFRRVAMKGRQNKTKSELLISRSIRWASC